MTTAAPTSPSLQQPHPAPPPSPPLLLTIRFSASLPDLELDIPRPGSTTVVSLKHLIRARLGSPNSTRRLRFIHGGKILPDSAVLSAVLRAPPGPPPPPPSSFSFPHPDHHGKTANNSNNNNHDVPPSSSGGGVGSKKGKSVPGRPDPAALSRIYVNCSIGDELSAAELESEAVAAAAPPAPAPLQPQQQHNPTSTSTGATSRDHHNRGGPLPSSSATTAPRGFDRLLSAGFTASEVNQLRLQFRSIHSSRYTPDALPSPDGFRRLEDAWIDGNGSSSLASGGLGTSSSSLSNGEMGGGGGTDSDEEVGLVAMVDVLIRGVVTGFVWPLGSAGWLVREEGMASGRWRFMVGVGVLFSVLLGMIRAISGDK
ncbi:DUF2407 C-terminal domain-containing protein [Biscogniauxia mediterranea]|nr:DUF2407 C-terminal domain-containing protein [Biscogniauxia mediterranea]